MIVDLRSDTLTKPCDAMRQAMSQAEVGDDVFDEDPTVKQLQSELAEQAGHEAGLFFPSGTQSNLVALLAHCQRGDEYIVGQNAHTYRYEGGGAAVLGSIQPQPIENLPDGTMALEKIKASIKEDDFHYAKTRLIALENTIGGKVISQDYIQSVGRLAKDNDLILHLDGARVFNAAVAQGVALSGITSQFDSVSICLSKGLGAPVGSVLVGDSSYIEQASRWRKMVGGGMRQVGLLAAAGLYAINNNVERLADDHQRAKYLVGQIKGLEKIKVVGDQANTNMLYLSCPEGNGQSFRLACEREGLLFSGDELARLVIHKDINDEMIEYAAQVIKRLAS